jgi:single-strand DNA-binding protein
MVNTIVLAGNVVADPEIKTTKTGKIVARVRLAVNNPMNDEEVLYINVDTWDKQAEFVQKFAKKGNSLTTQGRLKQEEWTGKDGIKRTSYCVVADKINFIGGKKKEAEPVFSIKDAGGNTILQVNDPSKKAPKVVVGDDGKEPMDDIQF